ncbi:DUF2155 domain-containing protein [Alphaproteobacteria bacterium]|nr:DUF2155 domain-containing protein [Alphaproteobacteria bacterium]
MFKKILFFFLLFIFSENLLAQYSATLRAIDRTTGRSFELNVPLNKEVNFSKLSIKVKYCYQNPINMEIENYAYIVIKDLQSEQPIFTGWMFSSTPSLNSLEHPINDIWLLKCNESKS